MRKKYPVSPYQDSFIKIVRKVADNEKRIYKWLAVLVPVVLLLTWLDIINVKKIFAFFVFIILGGVFKYLITRYRIWLEFTPVQFFCVIIAHTFGIFWVLPYIFIADIMAMFVAGQGPSGGSVPYWIWLFIYAAISLVIPLNTFGKILLPILYFMASLFIDQFIRGGLHAWRWASHIASYVINAYFFLKLTEFFIGMAL